MNTNPIQQMQNVIRNSVHELQIQINALVKLAEESNPGFTAVFQKQVFYEKCIAVMAGSEQVKARAGPDALSHLAANSKMIEVLKKQAQEHGMMDVFEKAQREAEHLGQEMAGRRPSLL